LPKPNKAAGSGRRDRGSLDGRISGAELPSNSGGKPAADATSIADGLSARASRARQLLGWEPEIELDEDLRRTRAELDRKAAVA